MVSTRNVQVAGYWITEFLGNVTHVQCRQVHDDSLLKSRGITVDIGYAASETKPDRPLIRHKMLHVIIEYFLSFFTRRIWLKTLNLQRRPVYTLPCPVQNFTIKTFESFNKRFITSATSWNDMHRFPWLSVTSTAWLQQCQWSSCCLCTQHLMWMCGCKAHCSLQCRNVQCNISQSQQFCFYGSSYLLPAGLTCVHFSFINLNCVLGRIRSQPRYVQTQWASSKRVCLWQVCATCTQPREQSGPCAPMSSKCLCDDLWHLVLAIESYNCLASPQLRCNSATGPAAVSAGNIWGGFVDATLIARFNADLYTPCNAHWNISQSQHFDFVINGCNQLVWHALSPMIVCRSTIWRQQCHWSSCCLCRQHFMRIRGCEQHFTLTTLFIYVKNWSSHAQPAGLTCI